MIKNGKKVILITSIFITVVLLAGYWIHYLTFHKPIKFKKNKKCVIYIRPETTWHDLDSMLNTCFELKKNHAFERIAKYKNLPKSFKQGHYLFERSLSANDLVNTLKYGRQTPINLVFNNVTDLSQLSGKVAKQMMFDSIELQKELFDNQVFEKFGYTKETFPAMFIPNKYQIYWTDSPMEFIKRMKSEHDKFWNNERKEKAKILNLSYIEISTLASIVEKESSIIGEMPIIAGVYINRLRLKMPLQADPTVVFANGTYSVRRVTKKMLAIESPYNTYKNTGIPPGPICIPSIQSIDAVLNHKKHDFLYFCASTKMDGTHLFARTLRQHNQNAEQYRNLLNKKKIYK